MVTDPCYVKHPDEYKTMISDGLRGMPSSKEPGHYVMVPVSDTFFTELKVRKVLAHSLIIFHMIEDEEP